MENLLNIKIISWGTNKCIGSAMGKLLRSHLSSGCRCENVVFRVHNFNLFIGGSGQICFVRHQSKFDSQNGWIFKVRSRSPLGYSGKNHFLNGV